MFLKFDSALCRVCLGPNAKIPLFGTEGNFEKFQSSSNLEIAEDDGLPTSLCENCSQRLYAAYEFRQQCVSSDMYLRSFIHSMNVKFTSEVETIQQTTSQLNTKNDTDETREQLVVQTNDESSAENEQKTDQQEETTLNIEVIQDDNNPEIIEDQRCTEEDENCDSNEALAFHYSYSVNQFDQEEPSEGADNKEETTIESNYDFREDLDDDLETENTQDSVQSASNITESFVCSVCQKPYSSRANLSRHMLTHSSAKPFECLICGATFTQSSSRKQHMLRHTGEKPHKCGTCGKGFTRNQLLKMHERVHTGEKPYHCDECNLSFTVKEGLRRHNMKKHSNCEVEIFKCDICNKELYSKYTLRNHLFLHDR